MGSFSHENIAVLRIKIHVLSKSVLRTVSTNDAFIAVDNILYTVVRSLTIFCPGCGTHEVSTAAWELQTRRDAVKSNGNIGLKITPIIFLHLSFIGSHTVLIHDAQGAGTYFVHTFRLGLGWGESFLPINYPLRLNR